MRLFYTERIQEDSSFTESCGFGLEGKFGFEHPGVGLGRAFQKEKTACAKAKCANASMCEGSSVGSMTAVRSSGNSGKMVKGFAPCMRS